MTSDGLVSPAAGAPLQVLLNVYDVAQGDSKGTVVRLNNLVGPKGLGLGGVFHGAIVLGTVELSFGFCEQGTGVYAVKSGQNPMYTFRETVDLGPTSKSMAEIRAIIQDMKQEWPGASYDLLHRNCCHFCVDLAARLGVAPVPGWLNRFASGAAATITMTQDTVKTVQDFGAEVGRLWNKTLAAASQQQQHIAEKLQQQQQHWRSHQQQQQQQQLQQQQQQQQRSSFSGLKAGGLLTPRGGQIADSAAQAGQQLWSGLTQAGLQLKATTTRLAQAAATRTGSSTPRPSSTGSSSYSPSSRHGSSVDGEAMLGGQQQQQQQGQDKGSWTHQGTAATAAAAAAGGAAVGSMLLGAQPKLSKEYRLSSAGSSQLAAAAAVADDGTAAAKRSGSIGSAVGGSSALQSHGSDDTLMPFLSVDDVDPFVALVGEDDGEDDEQQKAAVESALQQQPAAAVTSQ